MSVGYGTLVDSEAIRRRVEEVTRVERRFALPARELRWVLDHQLCELEVSMGIRQGAG